jgi:hypothetical protein
MNAPMQGGVIVQTDRSMSNAQAALIAASIRCAVRGAPDVTLFEMARRYKTWLDGADWKK